MSLLYSIEIWHEGLGKHRVITSSNSEIVQSKARAQMADWNAKYSVIQSKVDARREVDNKVEQGAKETERAGQALEQLRTLLSAVLDAKHEIDWESLKESTVFLNDPPAGPVLLNQPREPNPDDIDFRAELGLLDKIFGSRAEKKKATAAAKFEIAKAAWLRESERIRLTNEARLKAKENEIAAYNAEKQAFEEAVAKKNASIDDATETLPRWRHKRDSRLLRSRLVAQRVSRLFPERMGNRMPGRIEHDNCRLQSAQHRSTSENQRGEIRQGSR